MKRNADIGLFTSPSILNEEYASLRRLKKESPILDEIAKNRIYSIDVIPAKAGIHHFHIVIDSRLRGNDMSGGFFCEAINPWLSSVNQGSKKIQNDSMPYSKFEVGRSMFDVHGSKFHPPSKGVSSNPLNGSK